MTKMEPAVHCDWETGLFVLLPSKIRNSRLTLNNLKIMMKTHLFKLAFITMI